MIDLFAVMDVRKLGRIDSLELYAVILISIEGKFEIILNNIINIFGFSNPSEFSRDECHFFLDCLFRGLMKLLIPKKEKKPIMGG